MHSRQAPVYIYYFVTFPSCLYANRPQPATATPCEQVNSPSPNQHTTSTSDTIVLSRFSAYIMCFRKHSFSDEIYTIIYIILLYIVIPIHRLFLLLLLLSWFTYFISQEIIIEFLALSVLRSNPLVCWSRPSRV